MKRGWSLGLKLVFWGVLASMLAVTIRASLDRSVFEAGNLLADPWFIATLADAYFGFVTFYCWLAYKERGALARLVWFALVMSLGNIAMAVYVLRELHRLPAGAGPEALLLRTSATPSAPAGRILAR